MTKKKISYLLLGITLAFSLSACTAQKEISPSTKENQPQKNDENFTGKFSFKSLLTQNKSLICTYNYQDLESEFNVSGKTYLSGGRMFQDAVTTSTSDQNKKVKTNTLFLNNTIYSWSPDQKSQGMKIKVEPNTQDKVKTDVAGSQETMEKEYDLNCSFWQVDESLFKVPDDITFKDLSEMMNNLPQIPSPPAME